uniref:EF-hand domain-containing protein n=1 Tax=Anopheles dirus TaxID=7168 RepID=A0A182N7T6_9DIPT
MAQMNVFAQPSYSSKDMRDVEANGKSVSVPVLRSVGRSFRVSLLGTGAYLSGTEYDTDTADRTMKCKSLSWDLRTAFDLLDRDQDGHVTPEELQFMLRNLGIHVRDELIDDLLREASRTVL